MPVNESAHSIDAQIESSPRNAAIGRTRPGAPQRAQVWRTLRQGLSWLAACAGLYLGCVVLELYWNLIDWRPRPDFIGMAMVGWILATLAWLWRLAGTSTGTGTRWFALTLCLGLVAVGLYTLAPEPLTDGFLGRESSSSGWYRGGRLGLLSASLLFWLLRGRRVDQSVIP